MQALTFYDLPWPVFHYTYKRPGEDKEYVVVWDYNVGLVRMTPFFKSCKFSKVSRCDLLSLVLSLTVLDCASQSTERKPRHERHQLQHHWRGSSMPRSVLTLEEQIHLTDSPTGYWMPYEAAKAIAATFCYDIRWALTPIFGNDFPQSCTPPSDPNFAKFVIDPRIVQQCTEETDRFRDEGEWYKLRREPKTPQLKFGTPPWSVNAKTQSRLADTESGYGTDTDSSDKNHFSPQFSPRSQHSGWQAINGPSSSPALQTPALSATASPAITYVPIVPLQIPGSVPVGYGGDAPTTKRKRFELADRPCNAEASSRSLAAVNTGSMSFNDSRFYSDKVHSAEEVEVANILVWMSQGKPRPFVAERLPSIMESMMLSPLPPPPKRSRFAH
jgi:hypothetical protein